MTFSLKTLAVLLALPAAVQAELQGDAFGLFDPAQDVARAAWSGLQTDAQGQHVTVAPGNAAHIAFFAGPKSVVAGKDRVHLVAVAFDRMGNLLDDQHELRIAPGQGGRMTRPIIGGIADILHDPGTQAAHFISGAETGTVQSARAMYRIVSDLDSITPQLAALPDMVPETVAVVESTRMQDRYGNPVDDGTGLTVWLTAPDGGATRLDAEVTNAAARATLLSRRTDGTLTARATLGAQSSAPRDLVVHPLRHRGTLQARSAPLPELRAQRLEIGPFMTTSGHLLNDGASVFVTVQTDDTTLTFDRWVRDGVVSFDLPVPHGSPLTITTNSTLGRVPARLTALGEIDRGVRE